MGGAFKLDSNNIFIHSFDMRTIWIHQLDPPTSGIVKQENWKHLAVVGPLLDLDSLEICGTVVDGTKLYELIVHLCLSRVIVNREGFCYINIAGLTNTAYPVEYYRLNDLFGWSTYGVKPLISTTWSVRGDIEKGGVVFDESTFRETSGIRDFTEDNLHEFGEEIKSLREKLFSMEQELKETKSKLESSQNRIVQLEMELLKTEFFNPKTTTKPDGDSLPDEELKEVIERRQRPISAVRFYVADSPFTSSPQLGDTGDVLREFIAVDEDVKGLRPGRTVVYASDKYFDAKNWWFIRAEEKNERSMLAFYGGSHNEVEAYGYNVGIPYNKGEILSSDVQFFVGLIRGIGVKFVFLY